MQIPERLRRFLGGGAEPGCGEGVAGRSPMSRQPGGAGGDNARVGVQDWELGEAEELEFLMYERAGMKERHFNKLREALLAHRLAADTKVESA